MTPFLEWVSPCFLGLPTAPSLVMWLVLPSCSESLRECVDCHLELPADLRDREEVLPDLPDLAPYVPSRASSSSSSTAAS